MNSALQVLLKALSNIEQNEKQYLLSLQTLEKELARVREDLNLALTAKQEIQNAISKLGETNEDTSSKETASRSTATKKRK